MFFWRRVEIAVTCIRLSYKLSKDASLVNLTYSSV
jgi:hypothetical protein